MTLKKLNNEKLVDLHTEGIRDIITSVPPSIIRWGITIFLFVLVLIATLSAIIHYPEVIPTKIKVKFHDTQLWVRAVSAGRLQKVFYSDNQSVKKGDVLVCLETNDYPHEVLNLISPVNGKVYFVKTVNNGSSLSTGEAICYIFPDNKVLYGEMIVQLANRAKVSENQKVVVYFSNYGYDRRFSMVGKVDFISRVPYKEEGFCVNVSFPENTPPLKSIPVVLTDGMTLDAEIVTKDMTVLDRIYRNLSLVK